MCTFSLKERRKVTETFATNFMKINQCIRKLKCFVFFFFCFFFGGGGGLKSESESKTRLRGYDVITSQLQMDAPRFRDENI